MHRVTNSEHQRHLNFTLKYCLAEPWKLKGFTAAIYGVSF